MSFISVILIVLIVVSYFVLNYRRQLPIIKAARRLPGPKPLPLIGNACYLLKKDFDGKKCLFLKKEKNNWYYCYLWVFILCVFNVKNFPCSYFNFAIISEFLNSMLSLMDGYSSPARFWFGNKLYIVVYEPEQIKVSITNIAK